MIGNFLKVIINNVIIYKYNMKIYKDIYKK